MLNKIKDSLVYKEVDVNQAVSYNSAAIKSVPMYSNRDNFFKELDQLEFDKLVNKYCTDKFHIRVKRKLKSIIYIILKKTGLLGIVKKIF